MVCRRRFVSVGDALVNAIAQPRTDAWPSLRKRPIEVGARQTGHLSRRGKCPQTHANNGTNDPPERLLR